MEARRRNIASAISTAALDNAKTDDRVKAVALDLDGFTGGGQTALTDLSDAIRDVRASGKPVLAYATGYTDDSYQLASAASEIWLNPLGLVGLAGPGGQRLYYRGLLDKLGVTAHVYRVGTYKAAVEPFTRNDMSPEAKQNAQALADALLGLRRHVVAGERLDGRLIGADAIDVRGHAHLLEEAAIIESRPAGAGKADDAERIQPDFGRGGSKLVAVVRIARRISENRLAGGADIANGLGEVRQCRLAAAREPVEVERDRLHAVVGLGVFQR